MATKLCKKDLEIIAHFLGLTSKDIARCKLLCKSWHMYLNQIIATNTLQYDEKEEEKAYTPQYHIRNPNTIQIQRSQPVMVSTAPNNYHYKPKPKAVMVMTASPPNKKKLSKPHMFVRNMEEHKSPSFPFHRSVGDNDSTKPYSQHVTARSQRMKINASDFLKQSLERAFWRLDQHTLDKMIASGHSPHIQQIKITKHNGLLTEKEQKYIDTKQAAQHHIATNYSITSSPTSIGGPPHHNHLHRSMSTTNALKEKEMSFDCADMKQVSDEDGEEIPHNEMDHILSTSIHWKPEYPLHLLQDDKAYKRAHDHQKLYQKRRESEISDSRTATKQIKARLLPLTFSRSLTTNRMNIKCANRQHRNMKKQIMTQSTTNLMPHCSQTNVKRTPYYNLISPPHKPQIIKIKHVEPSSQSAMYSETDDVNRKIEEMESREVNIAINENEVAMDCIDSKVSDIELAPDNTEQMGSNLSKSLLFTHKSSGTTTTTTRDRIISDDSMMYYHAHNHIVTKREQMRRGYTIDSCDFEEIHRLRSVITPYELRKQHSLLRVIDANITSSAKEDTSAVPMEVAHALVLTGDMDAFDLNNNKLMGPLYSVEEKSDWNDMRKVDIKYANVLKKKRRKKQVNLRHRNTYLLDDDDAVEVVKNERKKRSFWGSIYEWFVGNETSELIQNSDDNNHKKSADLMMSCDEVESTMTCTTQQDIMYMDESETQQDMALTAPLLKQSNGDCGEEEAEDIQQISFWRDIVIPNWDLLHESGVVKLFWEREGIPSRCRGQVWFYAIGNRLNIALNSFESVYAVNGSQMDEYNAFIHRGLQQVEQEDEVKPKRTKSIFNVQQLIQQQSISDREAGETYHFCEGLKRKKSIERDISRLFEEEDSWMAHASHDDIVCVLMAFCNLRSSISYIQFLTHLTQILLQYQSPAIAFISLSNMINQEIFEIYIHCNVSQIRQRIEIFTKMLVYNCSDIARHLQKLSILADTYVMDWCNGLFSAQLPMNIVARIWDLYFLNGEIIIWKSAVALLICINENLNLISKSHHKCVKILQSIKKSFRKHNIKLNERYFVKKIYSIKLPRDVRKWFKKKDAAANRKKKKKKKRKLRKKKKKDETTTK